MNLRDAFPQVRYVELVNYETIVREGSQRLLDVLGAWMQTQPACEALPPQDKPVLEYDMPEGFKQYIDDHLDWEAEALIGYYRSER